MVGICRNCGQSSDAHDDEVCKNVWPKQPPSAPDTKLDERIAQIRERLAKYDAHQIVWVASDRYMKDIAYLLSRLSSSSPEGEDTQRLDWLEARARERHSVKIEHTYAWTEHGDYGTILSSGPEEFWLHEDQAGQSLRAAIDSARASAPPDTKPGANALLKDALNIAWAHLHRLDPVLTEELCRETPALREALEIACQ